MLVENFLKKEYNVDLVLMHEKVVMVGANSVVTKDIEPFTVVGGVPAKYIKHRK